MYVYYFFLRAAELQLLHKLLKNCHKVFAEQHISFKIRSNQHKAFSILRSPHANKNAQEHFALHYYQMQIKITNQPKTTLNKCVYLLSQASRFTSIKLAAKRGNISFYSHF